jgi:hypothetical protein
VRKSAVTFADNYLAKLDQQKRENKDQWVFWTRMRWPRWPSVWFMRDTASDRSLLCFSLLIATGLFRMLIWTFSLNCNFDRRWIMRYSVTE